MNIDPEHDFGTRECPACGCSVAANHNHCPICGYAFPNPPQGHESRLKWIAIAVIAAFVLLLVRGLW